MLSHQPTKNIKEHQDILDFYQTNTAARFACATIAYEIFLKLLNGVLVAIVSLSIVDHIAIRLTLFKFLDRPRANFRIVNFQRL